MPSRHEMSTYIVFIDYFNIATKSSYSCMTYYDRDCPEWTNGVFMKIKFNEARALCQCISGIRFDIRLSTIPLCTTAVRSTLPLVHPTKRFYRPIVAYDFKASKSFVYRLICRVLICGFKDISYLTESAGKYLVSMCA